MTRYRTQRPPQAFDLNKIELSKINEIFGNVCAAEECIGEINMLMDRKYTKGMNPNLRRSLILKEIEDASSELSNAADIFCSMNIDWEAVD